MPRLVLDEPKKPRLVLDEAPKPKLVPDEQDPPRFDAPTTPDPQDDISAMSQELWGQTSRETKKEGLPELTISAMPNYLVQAQQARKSAETKVVKDYLKKGKPRDILRATKDKDYDFIRQAVNTDSKNFDGSVIKLVAREDAVRRKMKELEDVSPGRQNLMYAFANFGNLFNLNEYLDRQGLNPFNKGEYSLTLEAVNRILAERPLDAGTLAVQIGTEVPKIMLEFMALPDIGSKVKMLEKFPRLRKMALMGTKLAVRQAVQAPEVEETLAERSKKVLTSGAMGMGIGATGAFIPTIAIRAPLNITGFSLLTYAMGGSKEDIIRTAATIGAFEAVGLVKKGEAALGRKYRKTLEKKVLSSKVKTIKAGFKEKGIDISKVPEHALEQLAKSANKYEWWQNQYQKGKVTLDVFNQRTHNEAETMRSIFGAIGRSQKVPDKPTASTKKNQLSLSKGLQEKTGASKPVADRAAKMIYEEGKSVGEADKLISQAKYLGDEAALAEVEPPTEAIQPTKPRLVEEKPAPEAKVTEKAEITQPAEAAEAEKARKPLPKQEVTAKKAQEPISEENKPKAIEAIKTFIHGKDPKVANLTEEQKLKVGVEILARRGIEVKPEDLAKIAPAGEGEVKAIKKIGDAQKILGTEAIVADVRRIDGVDYELYNANRLKDKRGFVRVFDADSGETVRLKEYPTFDQAEAAYKEAIAAEAKVARPLKQMAEEKAKEPKVLSQQEKKAIVTLRKSADSLSKQIEAKRNPAVAQQNITRRRAGQIASAAQDADRMERQQEALRAIADAIEKGNLPDSLSNVKARTDVEAIMQRRFTLPDMHKTNYQDVLDATKGVRGTKEAKETLRYIRISQHRATFTTPDEIKAIESLIKIAENRGKRIWHDITEGKRFMKLGIKDEAQRLKAQSELEQLMKPETKEADTERQIREKTHALIGVKIPGFFPTPKPVIDTMIERADIQEGMSVLEPSAGKGDIADALTEAGHKPKVGEVVPSLQEILKLKDYELAGTDFLEHNERYDRIVMNPPFEKGQDVEHVKHAYELLKPGGKLVSIMSEGPFFNTQKQYQDFREWFDEVGGESEKLSQAFKGKESFRQTGTASRIVEIDKPGVFKAQPPAVSPEKAISTEKIAEQRLKGEITNKQAIKLLEAKREQIRNDTKNQLKGDFNKFTPQARKKLDQIRIEITNALQAESKAGISPEKVKGKPGFVDVSQLEKGLTKFLKIVEPAKITERTFGKTPSAIIIKGIHQADVGRIEFNEAEIEALDSSLGEFGEKLSRYSNKVLKNLMAARGKPVGAGAVFVKNEALKDLAKEAPELVGVRKMITQIADHNYKYLQSVVGDDIHYVEDYFYGIYKDTKDATVENFLDYWHTTDRFIKQKKLPTVADAISYGLDLRDYNPVNNLRSEYMAISRLDGMIYMRDELMRTGKGRYIDLKEEAPHDWEKISEPVFKDVRVHPEVAVMIKSLLSTNKLRRHWALRGLTHTNNALRTLKFMFSMFHQLNIAKQSIADEGYLQFVQPSGTRGITRGFKKSDPIFKTPAYKDYVKHVGSHRYSIESQAERAVSNFVESLDRRLGMAFKVGALPIRIPKAYVKWLFQSYIPKVKYSKYLDRIAEIEEKLGRPLDPKSHEDSALKIEIGKEMQNFYGMMNERLFGRSGTVTSLMRLWYMSPGYFEGNLRTTLKSILQWGGKEGFKASRSRSNIINSLILSAIAATTTTLIMTGGPPKKPETREDLRDIFKGDTGKVDDKGRKIMVDFLTYDQDYWNILGQALIGKPDKSAEALIKRGSGGMVAPSAQVALDIANLAAGRALVDWKNDRVTEITDPFARQVLKIAIHEIKRTEPISLSVYGHSRRRDQTAVLSALTALLGYRPTLTEKDKREQKVLHRIYSLKGQQEKLYQYLGGLARPRRAVEKYNRTVKTILDSPMTPKAMKAKWGPKLLIDIERLLENKAYTLGGATQKPEDVERAVKYLKNFGLTSTDIEEYIRRKRARETKRTQISPLDRDPVIGLTRRINRARERMGTIE